MGVATGPPLRFDLSLRANDDRPVGVLWLLADRETPVGVTSATYTFRFDLPADDLWELDVDGVPVEPDRQIHVINGTSTPGDPGGWLDPSGHTAGQVMAIIPHTLWATVDEPWRGTWDIVAVSVDAVQRCLARGEFICEQGAGA